MLVGSVGFVLHGVGSIEVSNGVTGETTPTKADSYQLSRIVARSFRHKDESEITTSIGSPHKG